MKKTHLFVLICSLIFAFSGFTNGPFKTEQLKSQRVKQAYKDKEQKVKELVKKKGLDYGSVQIFIRALKMERKLQVFARDSKHSKYRLLKTYDFCSSSGKLGPKRKSGDKQIPEGFYYIDRFNPWSRFHLSLGVNYPNQSDKKLSPHKKLGGDIFLHGSCVTIGCIPITDDKIKELYILAVEAKDNGQSRIPVHFFPMKMTANAITFFGRFQGVSKKTRSFWENLKSGYTYFETNKTLPKVTVDSAGKYQFQ
jgi:murein L,D-transpeptidase YafK